MSLIEAQKVIKKANARLLSDFEKASGKIQVACLECGHEWTTSVTTLRNSSCKPCGYKRNAAKRLRPIEEIITELDAVGIDYISDYRGAKYPLTVKHRKCGHVTNNQKIHVLNRGFGCNTCWRVSNDEYHSYAKRHGGEVLVIASSTNKKSRWRCRNGCEFERTFHEMKVNDRYCNICSRQLSERICKAVFEALFNEPFDKIKLPDLRGLKGGMLEFDLYNEALRIAVEHHGSHHYRLRNKYDSNDRLKQQLKHDEIKRKYCSENGISLFEIPELFYKTSLDTLPNVIAEQAEFFGLQLPDDYHNRIAQVDPIGISTSDEMAYEVLVTAAVSAGYKLLEKKFRGGHAIHKFICNNGHKFSCKSYSFLQGHRCGKCYEDENRQPVLLSDGNFFKSANEAGKAIGVDSGSIHSALRRKHRTKGFTVIPITLEEYERLKTDGELKKQLLAKTNAIDEALAAPKLAIITSDGQLFSSNLEASNALTNNPNAVSQALRRQNATVGGVGVQALTESQFQDLVAQPEKIPALVEKIWPFGVEARANKKKRVILSDGRLFESVSMAANVLGVSNGAISNIIKRKGREARLKKLGIQFIDYNTFKQCLSDPSFLQNTLAVLWPNGFDPSSPIAKPVISDHGDTFNSVKEAAEAEGISAGHMSNSIKNGWKINGKEYRYKRKML